MHAWSLPRRSNVRASSCVPHCLSIWLPIWLPAVICTQISLESGFFFKILFFWPQLKNVTNVNVVAAQRSSCKPPALKPCTAGQLAVHGFRSTSVKCIWCNYLILLVIRDIVTSPGCSGAAEYLFLIKRYDTLLANTLIPVIGCCLNSSSGLRFNSPAAWETCLTNQKGRIAFDRSNTSKHENSKYGKCI